MSALIFQAQLTVGNMSNMSLFFVGTSIMGMMGTIPWSLWALSSSWALPVNIVCPHGHYKEGRS